MTRSHRLQPVHAGCRPQRGITLLEGLIALLLRVYSGRPARDVLAIEPRYIEAIGLSKHLSPTRSNGLAAMLARIREHAARALAG